MKTKSKIWILMLLAISVYWYSYYSNAWIKTDIQLSKSSLKEKQSELQKKLTPMQYSVTQEDSTEPPFDNAYWNNHEEGIYVDVVDSIPLFSSKDKYDSWTGWPSFTKPISSNVIITKEDTTFFEKRVEVRSAKSDSHLGHVFTDWPSDKWWLRYCMNSAALRFIPVNELAKEWFGSYAKLFK
jgi:methionine-R-sulfoxide reductase